MTSTKWLTTFVGLAMVLVLLRSACAPILITNDGPQHLWAAFVVVHDLPGYTRVTPPTANGAFHLLAPLLVAGVAPMVALSVVASIIAAAAAVAFGVLVTSRKIERWPVALLGAGLAQQLGMQAGTLPFMCGLAASCLVIADVARHGPSSATTRWLGRSLALLVVAWLHIVPAAVAGLVWAAVEGTQPGGRLTALVKTALAGGPALVVVALSTMGSASEGVRDVLVAPGVTTLVGAFLPQTVIGEVVVAVVAVASLVACFQIRAHRIDVATGLISMTLIVVGVVVAADAIGWNLMRERLLGLGLVLALSVAPVEHISSRWRRWVAVAAATWSVGVCAATFEMDRRIATVLFPIASTIGTLDPVQGRWAPVVTRLATTDSPRRGPLAAWLHIGQVGGLSIGGQPAFSQDDVPATHQILRPESATDGITTAPSPAMWPRLWKAPPEKRAGVVSAYAAWGATIPRLVVYGPLEEQVLFVARGHVVEQTTPPNGHGNVAYVTRFVGCDVDARLAGDAAVDDMVEVGFFPAGEPLSAFPVSAGRNIVHLHNVPCGDGLWFRLQRSGCREAPRGTRVPLPAVSSGGDLVLPCAPGP